MREELKTMKVWVVPTKVVAITLRNIPDEKYCECLTRLFNNKREQKAIKEITNYYGNNNITVKIDLKEYNNSIMPDEKEIEEIKNHIRDWAIATTDYRIKILDGDIKIRNGKIFIISEWDNKIPYLDEQECLIENFVEWED